MLRSWWIAFALAPLLSQFGLARAEVAVDRPAPDAIVLRAGDCATVFRQALALHAWARKLGEAPGEVPACRCDARGCAIDAGRIAPRLVSEVNGLQPDFTAWPRIARRGQLPASHRRGPGRVAPSSRCGPSPRRRRTIPRSIPRSAFCGSR